MWGNCVYRSGWSVVEEGLVIRGSVERRPAGQVHTRSRLGQLTLRLQTAHRHRSVLQPALLIWTSVRCCVEMAKWGTVLQWSVGGVLISHTLAFEVDRPLSLWRMASATTDLRLPSQPQNITAPWPVPNYTARWQRHMGVNNLPGVATQQCTCRKWLNLS